MITKQPGKAAFRLKGVLPCRACHLNDVFEILGITASLTLLVANLARAYKVIGV